MTSIGAAGSDVSKGARLLSTSRDVFSDITSVHTSLRIGGDATIISANPFGLSWLGVKSGGYHTQIPFFGTRLEGACESNGTTVNNSKILIDGSVVNHLSLIHI